jgi:hypothetical protein
MTSDSDKSNRDRDRTSARTSHGPGGGLTRLGWIVAAVLLTPLLAARCGYAHTSTYITPSSTMQTTVVPSEATPCTMHYRDPSLGFRLDYPCDSEVSQLEHGPCTDDPNRLCDSVLFQTTDVHGNRYGLTVFRYWPSVGKTITDTVEYNLRNLASSSRDQVEIRCCLTLSGEAAMELTYPQSAADDFRNRQVLLVHDSGEYWLVFWWGVPFQPGGLTDIPTGSAAQTTFDTFLQTFGFIPIAETPTPPPPMPTAAPTPTATPNPRCGDPPMPGGDSDISIQSVYVSSTRIVFSGQSSLPEGGCLHTQLLADGEPETWWPDGACATVDADGAWQIAVELSAADAPTRLDPTLDYVLRAWCPDNPSSPVQFWFDLAGPPVPD